MFKKISNNDLHQVEQIRDNIAATSRNGNAWVSSELGEAEKNLLTTYGFDLKSAPQYLLQDLSFALQPYYFLGANPTADCILIKGDEILLIKRGDEAAEGGKWAIPGGFVNTEAKYGQIWKSLEDPLDAALREVQEETKADMDMIKNNQAVPAFFVGIFEGNKRDPRDNELAWSKSYAYVFIIDNLPEDVKNQAVEGLDDAKDAKWIKISALPTGKNMAFDHEVIIKKALSIVLENNLKLNLNSAKLKM